MKHAPNLPPRLLSKTQAAAYCGVCPKIFDQVCPVKPIQLLERIPRYDRFALDQWMNTLDDRNDKRRLNPVLAAWDQNDRFDRARQGD
jgi:hypothetical protein